MQAIEADGRGATPDEQEILSRYVGWGGVPDAFDPDKADWANEYQELKAMLTEDEYASAQASTLNAHFTTPIVIRAIYEALGNMGFISGNILDRFKLLLMEILPFRRGPPPNLRQSKRAADRPKTHVIVHH